MERVLDHGEFPDFLNLNPKSLQDLHSDSENICQNMGFKPSICICVFPVLIFARKIGPRIFHSFSAVFGVSLSSLRFSHVFLVDIYGKTT